MKLVESCFFREIEDLTPQQAAWDVFTIPRATGERPAMVVVNRGTPDKSESPATSLRADFCAEVTDGGGVRSFGICYKVADSPNVEPLLVVEPFDHSGTRSQGADCRLPAQVGVIGKRLYAMASQEWVQLPPMGGAFVSLQGTEHNALVLEAPFLKARMVAAVYASNLFKVRGFLIP